MVTAFLFAAVYCLPGQAAQQDPPQDQGVAIISKMLGRYAASKTMTGTIRYTLAAGNDAAIVNTVLQYEKPSKIFLRQESNVGDKREWLVTSDGIHFSYDRPPEISLGTAGKGRLMEATHQRRSDGVLVEFVIGDIYKAASHSLIDRAEPLDIVIGRYEDLLYLRNQWKTVHLTGKVKFGSQEANHIQGQWRNSPSEPASGTYEMFINDQGDLLRFVRHENVQPPGSAQIIEVISTWDVSLVVNGTPDQSLFKVIK